MPSSAPSSVLPSMLIAQSLLPEFTHEMAGLRRVIERLPEGRLDYRPHPKSFTLRELASHLADIPGWAKSTLQETELDFGLPEVQASFPKPCASVQETLARLDQNVEQALALLAATPDEAFPVIWTLKDKGQVLLAMPRIAVYRGFILSHAIHHRAQLALYLRMLDLPVPALYGPSADEN